MMGMQVPSFNPKLINVKTPPISHPYATHSKGRPPVHSLSTTARHGKQWTGDQHNLRESPFVLGVLANLSGFRTMPESAGPGVVHFVPIYNSVGNVRNWHNNSFSIPFPS